MTAELITLERFADAYEMGVCKQVGDELERHYPGWMWHISCPPKGGVVQVRSGFMDPRHGFNIKLTAVYSASDLAKQAVLAGGELLERTGMPRRRYDAAKEQSAANKTAHDFLMFQR